MTQITIEVPEALAQQLALVKVGDLLVIDGDPLHDVRDLRKLTTVYRGGVAYDPQALLAQAPRSDFVPAS